MKANASCVLVNCLLFLPILSGCNGDYSPSPIGGHVTGLIADRSVVVRNNGGETVTITGNTNFSFPTRLGKGTPYRVTVITQPAGQVCSVPDGTGTVDSSGVDVEVSCVVLPNSWTWAGGDSTAGRAGVYGTLNVVAADNIPGARFASVSWTDSSGDVWIWSGQGLDAAGNEGVLNDLWKYSAGQWTWMGGSDAINASGSYGALGVSADDNMPGARFAAVAWTDSAGDFWMFGGQGFDSAGAQGALDDLWKYSSGQWTWMGGSNTINASGTYGTKEIAASGNQPGARYASTVWTDASGGFWLYGGIGFDAAGNQGFLNDLWEYRAGEWTWVSGASGVNTAGTYGTSGVADSNNSPGSRLRAVSWVDASGALWFFGGLGLDEAGDQGSLNDLWQFRAGQWTWMGGSKTIGAAGSYGTLGIAAAGNVPGARYAANAWMDSSGSVFLFGGLNTEASGNPLGQNDLWKYSDGLWTWVSGSSTTNERGTYGTPGVAASDNAAGARYASVSWTDSSGHLWLFGGQGYDSAAVPGYLGDLWDYAP